ncbi:cell wall hydrolase [Desulforamulus aeronauticus]|nr:cell wall hydrolase [Desulforamulus aeronauticus]
MMNIKKTIATLLIFATIGISIVPLTKPAGQADVAGNKEKLQVAKAITEKEQIQKEDTTVKNNSRPKEPQVSRGNLNRNEVTLLAMVIEGEAADEPYEGKVAVGAVILNRLEDKQFPKTLSGVVYEDLAFESVMNNQYKRPLSQESVKAAQAAIHGSDPTKGALYFWNPVTAKSKWVWSRPVTDQIGKHVFAK